MTRGFSLLEIMVVVGMIGMMAAVAVPSLSNASRRANAPVQAMRVHGFLSDARNLARRTNRCVKVTRSSDGETLRAQTISTCALTDVCRCRASNLPDETRSLQMSASQPSDARVSSFSGNGSADMLTSHVGADVILFLSDGSTPYASIAEAQVTFPDAEAGPTVRRLTIMPATGVVRLLVAGE